MTELNRLAAELNGAADLVGNARQELEHLWDLELDGFANAPGRLGEVGQRLNRQWGRAWEDRLTELDEAQGDLFDLAEAVERALARYAQAEDEARHGILRAEDM